MAQRTRTHTTYLPDRRAIIPSFLSTKKECRCKILSFVSHIFSARNLVHRSVTVGSLQNVREMSGKGEFCEH